ncbi:hypothetical protein SteCoe_5266 [Stentor coeruleus]|uniref:Maleylacetoacetate isomerase n=1 Tax=Stentor coeruleus TaxID=5963 RepID=A0A1R2CST5_9CILI|nr:hypothetical protein SteCoe_5266 [Stentor coeruleus]
MTYILYSYWQSSSAWRVRIALNIKKVPYTYKAIDLITKEHFSQLYSIKNPMLQVPLLETPTFSISQSLAIFKYLEGKYKFPTMIPNDIQTEAKMWEICEIINSGIQPLQNLSLLKKIKKLGGDPMEWAQENIIKGFGFIEDLLDHKKVYSVEDFVTFADACILPQLNNAKKYGVNVEKYPKILRVCENLIKVQEIIEAMPENQPDAKK